MAKNNSAASRLSRVKLKPIRKIGTQKLSGSGF